MTTFEQLRTRITANSLGPEESTDRPIAIATGIFNIGVPLCFLLFAWAHAVAFVHTLRISIVIILAKVVLDLHFYVRRSTGPFISTSAYAWLVALGGTVAPLLLRPTADESDFLPGTMLLIIGVALQIYVFRTLNGSFEAVGRRGVRGDGLYRFVRHPLYLAFILSQYGYVLCHTSLYNIAICALVIYLQVLRINEEERLLQGDEKFQEYAEQTPWRILPKVY